MGLFGFLKKDEPAITPVAVTFPVTLGAVADGNVVPMEQIPDDIFSKGVLGTCCGIDPSVGKVYAPVDGKINQLTETLHAVGIEAGGMEILIHVGIDTVDMNGDGFSNMVKLNQTVKKGDLLLTMDLEKISAAGHPTTIILAVTNSDDFESITKIASGVVKAGDDILQVKK